MTRSQTQARDAPERVSELMRALEDRVVVELCIGRQAVLAPTLEQRLQGALGGGSRHDPSVGQRTVQAGGGEHRDQWSVGDLQILDEIEAVELGASACQIGQIPALGRRWPALTMRGIEGAVALEHAVDRRARRDCAAVLLQRRADCIEPVFAQHTVLSQRVAQAQDALLHVSARAVPRPPWSAVGKVDPVDAFGPRTLDPVGGRGDAEAQLRGCAAQALSGTHRLNQLATPRFDRRFFAMTNASKTGNATGPRPAARAWGRLRSPSGLPALSPRALCASANNLAAWITTQECSGNAETQVFG